MRVWLITALLSALFAVTLVRPVRSQTLELPRPRQGYYLGGGLHGAVSRVTDGDEVLGYWQGSALTLRSGQMFTNQFGLGLGIHFGGTAKGPESASFGGLGLEGQWEPIENLALRGGIGFGVVGLRDEDNPDEDRRGSYGGDYSLSLSYDLFVSTAELSGGLAITPVVTLRYLPDDPVETMMGVFGVELIWWLGLPPNELELPAGEGYE
jgi:hypothetical protein